ncbi:MAG: N-acetyl-gamma-glutamyl-phosphate reductase [Pseudomonadota bacterium]
MAAPKVYIDGQAGTTGLRIREWLEGRTDIDLISVAEARRKNVDARRECISEADLCVLCLPDDAAREAVSWIGNQSTRVIDASTAHRVSDGWAYGLPELTGEQRDVIREAQFVANPGCYPSAFVLLVRPLIDAGLLGASTPFAIHALSGYSGGGRPMIERWEADSPLTHLPFEAPYALDKVHKHVPELRTYGGCDVEPQFVPAVGPFRCGMRVEVPIHASLVDADVDEAAIRRCWEGRYAGEPFVRVGAAVDTVGEMTFDPRTCNDTNAIELHVKGHPSGHIMLIALLDNLGKGASGAAIQNMNLMLGLSEGQGLPG